MIDNRTSNASKPNPHFLKEGRRPGESNPDWIKRQLGRIGNRGETFLVLFGGNDPASVSVRMAQAPIRNDQTPSWWSHSVIIRGATRNWKRAIWDVPFSLDLQAAFPSANNGLVEGDIEPYSRAKAYPNVAVVGFPAKEQTVRDGVKRFRIERSAIDATRLLWIWIGHVLGVGTRESPLYEGAAYPSAAMAQLVFGAAGLDLTPNASTSAGCPETLWQAARWWHEFLEWDEESGDPNKGLELQGAYHVEHRITNTD